jgi:CBS-domain-containing membrane protein
MMNTEMQVNAIMTTMVARVLPSDTFMKVEEVLQSFPIHHVLVSINNHLVGIISQQDILKEYQRCSHRGVLPERSRCTAADIMTANPVTVETTDTIGLAADIFLSNMMHALPVSDGKNIVGIVTSHDVLRYAFK